MKTLFPTRGRCGVEREGAPDKTGGGLFLPDSAKEKPTFGTILAIGAPTLTSDVQSIDPSYSVGDRIVFTKWAGSEVELDGKDLSCHGPGRSPGRGEGIA